MLVRMKGIIAWIALNTQEDTRKKLEPILVEKIIFADYGSVTKFWFCRKYS